jgi:hypothetical protein
MDADNMATAAIAVPDTNAPKPIVRLGIAPTTLDEGWRLAQMFAKSDLVPKNFRSRPEDIMVAIQYGLEIGLPPMAALSSIAVVNGRASLWGDGFLAVLMSSPLYADHDEYYEVTVTKGTDPVTKTPLVATERRDRLSAEELKQDSTLAVCTFWRHGKKTPVTRTFSIAQAKKAGLWGKAGPWQEYGDRMLSMRARGFAGRDGFPDLLRGIKTAEEVLDTPPDIDVTPIAVAPAAPVKPAGYDDWTADLVAAAENGDAKLTEAWKGAQPFHRHYLMASEPASWESLKARALSVDQAVAQVQEVAQ